MREWDREGERERQIEIESEDVESSAKTRPRENIIFKKSILRGGVNE